MNKDLPDCGSSMDLLKARQETAMMRLGGILSERIPLGLALLIAPMLSPIFPQVNTEAMRREVPGLHSTLSVDLGCIAGNSSLQRLKSNLRFDYFTSGDHLFLVMQYQRDSADRLLTNKGFAHLRGVKILVPHLKIEGFLQQEFNEFINLDSRQLAGGGMRIGWHGPPGNPWRVNTGIGLMWECERVEGTSTNLIRSTNYLVVQLDLNDITLFSTTYYQVDLRRSSDYRILWEGRLALAVTKRLSLTINLNFRYDNEPPAGIKPYDLNITNGVSYNL